jgi:orotate phosphoribosyltransferase
MDKISLGRAIYKIAHLTGQFKLRSGKTSPEYFDKYRFEAQPELLKEIARHLKTLIPKGTEILAGLEMGGIPVATALSLETGLPVVFVRKAAKDYGTCKLAEGLDLKGKEVCVIEDVVTTGGQVVTSSKDLRQLGARVTNVLCVIFRGDGDAATSLGQDLKLYPLFTKPELETAARTT